ncbi:MAG: aldehyde dehydrogenase family protein [Myxococcales bacterium]|nr:aldehyde dehydrogenase family protein [Myxococcales bacterium]
MHEPRRRTVSKRSPVDGALLCEVPVASPDDVAAAVARARGAADAWAALGVAGRLRALAPLRDRIAATREALAETISRDTGKPKFDSLLTEVSAVPLFLDYYTRVAPKVLGVHRTRTPLMFLPHASHVQRFPMGVIAVISPWNFPFRLSVVPMLTALIAGNTVVLKPSEVTPLVGEAIREMFAAVGLPEGVVEVVQGDGETGAALCRADVDKIFFTGSVATGKKVMAVAAEKPIPVELELGGKDAMIVCADADLQRAANAAAWGGLVNAGQMCTSVERVLVVDSVHDDFVRLLGERVAALRVGGPHVDADMGPLTFERQLATVERHVADAVERGARVVCGGRRIDELGEQFYAPTVLVDVTPEMEIYREETFGPVLPVVRVRDEEEAVRLANDHQYGLTGSVWTRDRARGLRLASRVAAGQVCVNDVVISVGNFALPFGGIKGSGFGRYHGVDGLLAFSHTKAIMSARWAPPTEPFWFPYRGKYSELGRLVDSLLARNLVGALASKLRLRPSDEET